MKYTVDCHTISDLYYKKVILKEETSFAKELPPDFLKFLNQNTDQLANKINKLRELLLQNTITDEVLNKIEENPEEVKQINSEDLKESYISEGIGSRIKSNLSGWKRFAYGEKTPTGEGNVQSHRVNKRFEIFKDKVGKHLRELERDLETTSSADETVKNEIKQMISKLSSEEFGNITPKQSKIGDIRHKMGRGVEWAGKSVTLGAIAALLGGGIASVAGATGIAAGLIQGAVIGAVRKAGMDIINGKKPSAKQVATQAAIVAALGGIANLPVSKEFIAKNVDAISDYLFGGDKVGLTASDNIPTVSNDTDYFELYHDTPFDPNSELDKAKYAFDQILSNKGFKGTGDWSNGPSPTIVNAASEANLNADDYEKLTKAFGELSEKQLGNFKANFNSNPEKYAKALVKTLLKK